MLHSKGTRQEGTGNKGSGVLFSHASLPGKMALGSCVRLRDHRAEPGGGLGAAEGLCYRMASAFAGLHGPRALPPGHWCLLATDARCPCGPLALSSRAPTLGRPPSLQPTFLLTPVGCLPSGLCSPAYQPPGSLRWSFPSFKADMRTIPSALFSLPPPW